FFFEAEDGIRDGHVTGVQTCALPIWFVTLSLCLRPGQPAIHASGCDKRLQPGFPLALYVPDESFGAAPGDPRRQRHRRLCRLSRSEEHRVGKECRTRGAW